MTLTQYKLRSSPSPSISYGPPSKQGERWIEQASKGLRRIGTISEIRKREGWRYPNHDGWFINECQDETFQGIVYQLPAHRGKLQFRSGYLDPWNPDCFHWSGTIHADLQQAVQSADEHARICAEHEREYQAAAAREFQLEENTSRIHAIRTELRSAIAELRQTALLPTLCALIRSRIVALRDESHTLHLKNLKLQRGY